MRIIEPLLYSNSYHSYNRGIIGCDLFPESQNYRYFLQYV